MSAATTQFSSTPDPLPSVSTTDFGEQHQYKPEVETLHHAGSTNILATETDIDAISISVATYVVGTSFSLVCMPTLLDASFTKKFQDGGRIPAVFITL